VGSVCLRLYLENTMDKDAIKAFIAWLETATEEEILQRREQALKAQVSTHEGKADVRLALRLIDEELIARLDLKQIYLGKD
jgi:pyridoxine/pyridoxamine 5'-phosphate oxidase